jgi:5-methylcytosine-specific restriction endonuclease McrA
MSTTKKKNVATNGGKWIRQDKRLAIYLRDGLSCVYCGATFERGDTQLTLDHVTSQSMGGGNDADNLVTACKSCNSKKQDKSIRAFVAYLKAEGADAEGLAARIRKHTKRSLRKYRKIAKAVIKARG